MKNKVFLIAILCMLSFLNCGKDDDEVTTDPDTTTNPDPNIEFDPLGSIDFVKTYGGTLNESARSVISTDDGGYAVLGYAQSMDGDIVGKLNDSFDYWLLKFSAQGDLQWSKNYGGSDNDRANDIIQTKDGGYAIIGLSFSMDGDVSGNPDNIGNDDIWVAKLDASGNITWESAFGFIGVDQGFSVIESSSGGYLITGILDVTSSGGEGNTLARQEASKHAGGDIWALKLDDNGALEWSKFFGGGFTEIPEEVIEVDDGYLIAGWTDSVDFDISGNIGSYDFWILKIDTSGLLKWEKNFGGTEIDELFGMVQSGDGNFVMAGSTRSSDVNISGNKGGADFWVVKVSPSGDLIWEKSYGGSGFDVARTIKRTSDDGFVVAGSSRSQDGDVTLNQGQNDGWVLKIGSSGEVVGEVSFGGSDIDFIYDVAQLNDGTIIAVGDTFSTDGSIQENKGLSDLLIVKIK